MAVPKKRQSSSRSRMRRAHHALKKINYKINPITGEPELSHHISKDGTYNGRKIRKSHEE